MLVKHGAALDTGMIAWMYKEAGPFTASLDEYLQGKGICLGDDDPGSG